MSSKLEPPSAGPAATAVASAPAARFTNVNVARRGSVFARYDRADDIRRLLASPGVVVGSAAAVTETGSLVIASASGSQLPAYAGGAAHAIWVVGAQKVVADLESALRRVEKHALPLENVRAQAVYGSPSAVNRLLVLNAETHPGRATALLVREAVGFQDLTPAPAQRVRLKPYGRPRTRRMPAP